MPKNAMMTIDLSGGVNLHDDVGHIADSELAWCQNMVPVRPGVLSMRPSAALVGVAEAFTSSGSGYTHRLIGMYACPYSDWQIDFLYLVEIIDSTNTRVDVRLCGTTASGKPAGSASFLYNSVILGNAVPTWAADNDRIYICSGAPYVIVLRRSVDKLSFELGLAGNASGGTGTPGIDDGYFLGINTTTLIPVINAFNPMPAPAVSCQYRSHTAYGNLGPGFENAILLSAEDDPLVISADGLQPLAANGRYFTVGENSEPIIAMREIATTSVGAPVSAAMLVFKERSAYLVTGMMSEPVNSVDLQDLTVSKFSLECGCASVRSIVQTPYGLVWASKDDVWLFNIGATPQRIGTKIRPRLIGENPMDQATTWHATYADGFYRLAIASDGPYTPCEEQWWLDLRDGGPSNWKEAKWWGPQVYKLATPYHTSFQTGTRDMVTLRDGTPVTLAFSDVYIVDAVYGVDIVVAQLNSRTGHDCDIKYEWAPTWVSGTTYSIGDYVSYNGHLYSATTNGVAGASPPVHTTINIATDGGVYWQYLGSSYIDTSIDGASISTYIDVDIRTKSYDYGDTMVEKVFTGAEVDTYASTTQQFVWDLVVDEGMARYSNHTAIIQPKDYEVGMLTLDTDTIQRVVHPVACKPLASERIVGNSHQFILRNNPGYVVQSDKNKWLMVGADLAGGDPFAIDNYAAALVPGLYATWNTFMTMAQAAITSALGITGVTLSLAASRQRGGAQQISGSPPTAKAGISAKAADNTSPSTISSDVMWRAAQLLGLDKETTLVTPLSYAPTFAPNILPYKISARWDIGEIRLKLRLIPRRPT